MSRVLPVAMLSLALSVGGCSIGEHEPSPESEPTTTWQVVLPEITEPPVDEIPEPGSVIRDLLAQDAPIQIIYEPTTTETTTTSDLLQDLRNRFIAKLLARDKPYLDSVLADITAGTEGRYRPSGISVVVSKPIDVGGECLDSDDSDQKIKIRDIAEPLRKIGALNVIVVNTAAGFDCDTGGYNGTDKEPVLASASLTELGNGTDHETGHGGNLEHAGVKNCKDPILIERCRVKSTADPGSIMSYTHEGPTLNITDGTIIESDSTDGDHFSIPELNELGLLNAGEVLVDPESGDYIISDVQDNSDKKSTKLISLKTDKGEIYLSWEKDPQAAYDVQCDIDSHSDSQYDAIPESNYLYGTGEYICYKTNIRHMDRSLQVRLKLENDKNYMTYFDLITRPVRGHPEPTERTPSTGEVQAGATLYKDSKITVTFLGAGHRGQARVRIFHKR